LEKSDKSSRIESKIKVNLLVNNSISKNALTQIKSFNKERIDNYSFTYFDIINSNYKSFLKYDNRNIFSYFNQEILPRNIITSTFCGRNILFPVSVKICLLFFSLNFIIFINLILTTQADINNFNLNFPSSVFITHLFN